MDKDQQVQQQNNDANAAASGADGNNAAASNGGNGGAAGAGAADADKGASSLAGGVAKAEGDAGADGAAAAKDANGQLGAEWRKELATGADGKVDEKYLKQLERYSTRADYVKAHQSALQKISEGLKAPAMPGKDAKPEEKAAWRAANGIDEDVSKYSAAIVPTGTTIGDADKPGFDLFASKMHAVGAHPAVAQEAYGVYQELVQQQVAQQETADAEYLEQLTPALREAWGADFKTNGQAVKNFMAGLDPDVANALARARTADGRYLGDNPKFHQMLAQVARDLNPIATVAPGNAGSSEKALSNRLTELKGIMDKSFKDWHSPQNAANRQEYEQLLEIQLSHQARGKAGQ